MRKAFLACIATIAVISSTIGFCSFGQAKPEEQSASSGGSLFTQYEGNLLSVDIKDASLEAVLRKLADQTGISFSLPPSLCKDTLMVRFANFAIDEGIAKVLSPYDRVFIYDQAADKTEDYRTGTLREVRIYLKDNKKGGAYEKPLVIGGIESGQAPAAADRAENKQVMKTSPKHNTVKSLREWSQDLQEGDETARINAIQGLARMGGEGTLGPLTSALEDPNPEVRSAAESALTDLYASLEEENNLPGSGNDQQQTIEGAPSFTIDTTGSIEGTGGQMEVDVRLSDVPEKLITSGFMLTYDPSQMEITGVDVYDGSSLNGPWDSEMTNKVPNPAGQSGKYMIIVGNLGSVTPDENGTIDIARLRVNCTGNCNGQITVAPVPDFDTSVGNSSTVYDSKMPPTQFTIDF